MEDNHCEFCEKNNNSDWVLEKETVYAIYDQYPVTEGHLLVIPKRHIGNYFDMNAEERMDTDKLLFELREMIEEKDPSVNGFNIGMNCGQSAGQTIMHAHVHLIPRRDGDSKDPRGGVRGVIPERKIY